MGILPIHGSRRKLEAAGKSLSALHFAEYRRTVPFLPVRYESNMVTGVGVSFIRAGDRISRRPFRLVKRVRRARRRRRNSPRHRRHDVGTHNGHRGRACSSGRVANARGDIFAKPHYSTSICFGSETALFKAFFRAIFVAKSFPRDDTCDILR